MAATTQLGAISTCAQAVEAYARWMEGCGRPMSSCSSSAVELLAFLRKTGFLDKHPSDIDECAVSAYVNRPGGVSMSTRLRQKKHIHAWLKFCVRKGWCFSLPTDLVPIRTDMLTQAQRHPKRINVMTNDQVQTLLNACTNEPFWRFAIVCSRDTGLRLGDIAKLEWESVDRRSGFLSVATSKTGSIVEIPVSDRLRTEILCLKRNNTRYVFPYQAAMSLDCRRRGMLSYEFLQLRKSVGVEGVCFHSLRHSFITEQSASGKSIQDVAVMAGHSNCGTTAGYIHCPGSLTDQSLSIDFETLSGACQPKNEILASFSSIP